jgi:DNA-binding response OmpR family regulator
MTFHKRILLIDRAAVPVRRALEETGYYEIREEHNSRIALHAARRFQPDLILLEAVTPACDRDDIARQLQDDPALQNTPIMFLTNVISIDEVCSGGMIGGYSFASEPIGIAELVRCVGEMLHDEDAYCSNGAVA